MQPYTTTAAWRRIARGALGALLVLMLALAQPGPVRPAAAGVRPAAAARLQPSAAPADVLTGDDIAWDACFGLPGVPRSVSALAISGADVYVSASFEPESPLASTVARWDGQRWAVLGEVGVDHDAAQRYPRVDAIAVLGSDVYIGGLFDRIGGVAASNIARWDGQRWWPLGGGVTGDLGADVHALAVGGGQVYVGGFFDHAGGVAASNIARWDGQRWSALGQGIAEPWGGARVLALAASGQDVYVGGTFDHAGGVAASNVARWDGQRWSALGQGVTNTNISFPAQVSALAADQGTLYVGGLFDHAGGVAASNIARWDGSAWAALGAGLSPPLTKYRRVAVNDLVVHGGRLYAGGSFTTSGDQPVLQIGSWDGAAWSSMGGLGAGESSDPTVTSLALMGDALYVGGQFSSVAGVHANNIARWDGGAWSVLSGPATQGVEGVVNTVAISGTEVYAGGQFGWAGGVAASNVARWDGQRWWPLGADSANGVGGTLGLGGGVVNTVAISGTEVYAGGQFTRAGEARVSNIARWDGRAWSALGNPDNGPGGVVHDMAFGANGLYVVGDFETIGGLRVNGVARWDGSTWVALGSGAGSGVDGVARAVAVVGPDVYVGGSFSLAGGLDARNIARWDGQSWSALGSGIDNGTDGGVEALAGGDDGLYVGGSFAHAGGAAASGVARWDGQGWAALGAGADGAVRALAVVGEQVYIGGQFAAAGDAPARNVARWDGQRWAALGSGVGDARDVGQQALALGYSGGSLYVGGRFDRVGGRVALAFSRWSSAPIRRAFLPALMR